MFKLFLSGRPGVGHFTVSHYDTLHEIPFKGIVWLERFERLQKLLVIIVPLERVPIFRPLYSLIVGHLRATQLLGHQGLLLTCQEAAIKVAKTYRVLYDLPYV